MNGLDRLIYQTSEIEFIRTIRRMDQGAWQPGEFIQAVRWALIAGAYQLARNLSAEGAKLYPENSELQRMAYVLSPPKIIDS